MDKKREEYDGWQKSKHILLHSIDRNKTLPAFAKAELKLLVAEHFRVIGKTVATYELLYLREKQ